MKKYFWFLFIATLVGFIILPKNVRAQSVTPSSETYNCVIDGSGPVPKCANPAEDSPNDCSGYNIIPNLDYCGSITNLDDCLTEGIGQGLECILNEDGQDATGYYMTDDYKCELDFENPPQFENEQACKEALPYSGTGCSSFDVTYEAPFIAIHTGKCYDDDAAYTATLFDNYGSPLFQNIILDKDAYENTEYFSLRNSGEFTVCLYENDIEIDCKTIQVVAPPPKPVDIIGLPEFNCDQASIITAIGCIPFGNPTVLAARLVVLFTGLGGIIALLMAAYASINIMSSTGDPRKVAQSKELLLSAIGGLILLSLSVFIMRFLGVTILGLF